MPVAQDDTEDDGYAHAYDDDGYMPMHMRTTHWILHLTLQVENTHDHDHFYILLHCTLYQQNPVDNRIETLQSMYTNKSADTIKPASHAPASTLPSRRPVQQQRAG